MLTTDYDGRTPLTTVDITRGETTVSLGWQQLCSDAKSNGSY